MYRAGTRQHDVLICFAALLLILLLLSSSQKARHLITGRGAGTFRVTPAPREFNVVLSPRRLSYSSTLRGHLYYSDFISAELLYNNFFSGPPERCSLLFTVHTVLNAFRQCTRYDHLIFSTLTPGTGNAVTRVKYSWLVSLVPSPDESYAPRLSRDTAAGGFFFPR